MTHKWKAIALPILLLAVPAAADPPQRPPDWTRVVFHTDAPRLAGMAPGGTAGAVIAGAYRDSIEIGGASQQIGDATPDEDIFITRLNGDGQVQWAKVFGRDGADEEVLAVTTDADGNVYIVAKGTDLDLGCGATVGVAVVAKLWSGGACRWSRAIDVPAPSGSALLEVSGLLVAPDGGIVVSGNAAQGVTWPGGAPVAGQSFIAKLDGDGRAVWTVDIDGATGVEPTVGVDAAGNLTVGMTFFDHVAFSGQSFSVGQTENGLLARFAADGTLLATKQLGGAVTSVQRVAVSADGAVAVLGLFRDSVQLDSVTLSAADGQGGAFVAKWAPRGYLAFARGIYGLTRKTPIGLAIDATGDVQLGLQAQPAIDPETGPIPSDFSIGSFFRVLADSDQLFVAVRLAGDSGAVKVLDPFSDPAAPNGTEAMVLTPAGHLFLLGTQPAFSASGDEALTRLHL